VGDAAGRDGLRLWDELLAPPARLAGGGGLGAAPSGAAGAPARGRADRLEPSKPGQRLRPGEKRGSATGPNPTDRGKPGTKRHLVTDARGTPLGFCLSGANRHDSKMLAPTLDAIPPLRNGQRGRPRQRPDKLHADKAYDARPRRQECRARGIVPRIARKGVDSSERLGRHRWVVERTHAWFNRFRRLPIRYERRADIYEAFTSLTACLITLNQIRRFC
jgi:transposase